MANPSEVHTDGSAFPCHRRPKRRACAAPEFEQPVTSPGGGSFLSRRRQAHLCSPWKRDRHRADKNWMTACRRRSDLQRWETCPQPGINSRRTLAIASEIGSACAGLHRESSSPATISPSVPSRASACVGICERCELPRCRTRQPGRRGHPIPHRDLSSWWQGDSESTNRRDPALGREAPPTGTLADAGTTDWRRLRSGEQPLSSFQQRLTDGQLRR